MMKRMAIAILALTGIVAAGVSGVAAQDSAEQDFEWRGRIDQGDVIEIKGVNGSVYASFADGDEVEVRATKKGTRGLADVRVDVVEHNGGVTICAVYPDAGSLPNTCERGDDGRMNTKNNDVEVDFEVKVPAGVRFSAKTVNGEIEAHDLRSDASASTVNGSVHIKTTGIAEASTVNGSVFVSMDRTDWSGELSFSTVNGNVTVELPASLEAVVHASTVSGNLQSDFPLTVSGRFASRTLSGTIGSGGRDLSLSTVNGTVELRKKS